MEKQDDETGDREGVSNFTGTSPSRVDATCGVPKRRGAPPGNQHALKHGRYTGRRSAQRGEVLAMVRQANALIAMAEKEFEYRKRHAPRGPRKWVRDSKGK